MKALHARLLLVLLFFQVGCAAQDGGPDWGGTVETLPNGAVRVVNPAVGAWGEEHQWRLVPELVLGGEVAGPEWEVFSAVIGLEADDQGRIYVLDRMANELRIFSPEGGHVGTVGRSGGGPGEYQNANGLEWLSPDTLLVIDQRGNRYSVLTKDGEFVRSVQRQLTFFGWAFRGGVADGRVFEFSSVRDGDDRHLAFLSTALGGSEPSSVDTLMLPESDAPPYESFSVRNERGGMTMGVPFAPSAVFHLDPSGEVWHGHGSEFTVFRSSLTGDTISEIMIESEPAPVSQEELAEWESGPAAQRFLEMGGDLDMARIPFVKPYFDDLHRDPEGFLWVSVPSGPSEVVFTVIDPEGKYLGRLEIDGVERDIQVGPVVRNGKLYLVGRDEFDVQHVHVFRIEK